MSEPIEEAYFNWLCAKVLDPHERIYRGLLEILHRTEFVWLIPEDRNRAEDGLELRDDFLRETHLGNGREVFDGVGCSVFEMLVGFSKRASFQTDILTRDWFWQIITNLRLDEYRLVRPYHVPEIEEILYRFVFREYSDAGDGGLFPLRWPKEDQRGVEIWYQFCEYVEEQDLV